MMRTSMRRWLFRGAYVSHKQELLIQVLSLLELVEDIRYLEGLIKVHRIVCPAFARGGSLCLSYLKSQDVIVHWYLFA